MGPKLRLLVTVYECAQRRRGHAGRWRTAADGREERVEEKVVVEYDMRYSDVGLTRSLW